jgi:polar amino acid transport system substrate-binding protein
VRNSKGKLVLSGDPFSVAPYGIAVAKGSGLTEPLQKAVNKIIANGVYDNILLKWDLQAGSIGKSIINGAQK